MLTACLVYLALSGCTTWQAPDRVNDGSLRGRAVTTESRGVRLSATVLSTEDSRQLFGADVNGTGVQPVWIEVENQTSSALFLLRTGVDPNYFSPLEVAWSFHAPLSRDRNAQLDAHFDALGFQNPISPGTRHAGIIFTNPHLGMRLLNIDLMGDRTFIPFTLFLPVPDDATDEDAETIVARVADTVTADYRDLGALRAALEDLPCCTTGAEGRRAGDPLNVVLVGRFADVAAAVVRRGFRRISVETDDAQRLFGRPADFVIRKTGQAGVAAHWMRVWVAPLRYQGKPVFLAQAGRPIGGRFGVAQGEDLVLHPDVDEVRNLLIQDLMYSGGLATLGFVTGVGAASAEQPTESLGGATYYTDGARAVMFFTTRPRTLSDLEILDWIRLPERGSSRAALEKTDERL